MSEGFIVIIPVTLLSLCILLVWFFKGSGTRLVKLQFLAVYCLISFGLFGLFDSFYTLLWLMLIGFVLPVFSNIITDRNAV